MADSKELYNKFAPYYRLYSEKRATFIDSINKIIYKYLPVDVDSLLDIGSGDGVRGNNLAMKLRIKEIVHIDNSVEMVRLARKGGGKTILFDISSTKTFPLRKRFDMAICLWNVLGHIPTHSKRLQVLKNIRLNLKKGGRLFLDVSNRYNTSYYGWKNGLRNMFLDFTKPHSRNGDITYAIEVSNDLHINTTSHFFSPFEMRSLIKKSRFYVEKEIYVDYKTGEIKRFFSQGQLFYVLKPV